jgi:hypothetical protein
VLFSTVVVHGEMLWFCRVPARAREKDAKKWKFAKNLVQNPEFFYDLEISIRVPELAEVVTLTYCKFLQKFLQMTSNFRRNVHYFSM